MTLKTGDQPPTHASGSSVTFLLVSSLKGLCFNPHRTDGLVFQAERGIRVAVRSTNAADSSREGFDNLECKTSGVFPATQEEASFVGGLLQGRYIAITGAPVRLPVRVQGEERIDRDGQILVKGPIPFRMYPIGVQRLWTLARDALTRTQERFLRLLRWSQGIDGPHDLYESEPHLYWNVTPAPEHHYASGPIDADRGSSSTRGIVWNSHDAEATQKLWEIGAEEPVAHELLREARALARTGSHRSALLMAATSIETGVKDHIGRLIPDTQWILQNAPSPPIHKILRKYIREMHHATPYITNWDMLNPLWKACGTLAEARNETAHVGRSVDAGSIAAYLETANDVLYVLDVLAGRAWARGHVSAPLRKTLGWPSARAIFSSVRWLPDPWELGEVDDTP
jgi:hypothetical protein